MSSSASPASPVLQALPLPNETHTMCSFCKILGSNPARIAEENKEVYDFYLDNGYSQKRYEGCTCENPSFYVIPINHKPIHYNPCGCKSMDKAVCIFIRESPFKCCGKCEKAIEIKKIVAEKKKEGQPFAVACECSCHSPQITQSI